MEQYVTFDIPVIMASGDCLCGSQGFFGDRSKSAGKEGGRSYVVECLPPAVTKKWIEEVARATINLKREKRRSLKLAAPTKMEIESEQSDMADRAALCHKQANCGRREFIGG
jgi:D-aminopeptidase